MNFVEALAALVRERWRSCGVGLRVYHSLGRDSGAASVCPNEGLPRLHLPAPGGAVGGLEPAGGSRFRQWTEEVTKRHERGEQKQPVSRPDADPS